MNSIRTPLFLLNFLFFLCAAVLAGAPASAQNIFTIDNVRVDVTAENALQARDQAFEQAQIKAFKMLGNKLKESGDIEVFNMPKPSVISSLVQDYEITNEKLSAVRYIGTYTFRFRENLTRRYLMPRQIQTTENNFSDTHSTVTDTKTEPYRDIYATPNGPLLILPFFETPKGEMLLWSSENKWLNAWANARALNGPIKIHVPIGDLADVEDIKDNEALTYDQQGLDRLTRRYNANGAVIAIATAKNGNLNVDIYRPRQPRTQFVQRINVGLNIPPDLSDDEGFETQGVHAGAFNLAVQETFKYLQDAGFTFVNGRTYSTTSTTADVSRSNTLYARVPFNNPREWARTQHALRSVKNIKSVQVKSLSPKSAYVELSYQGSEQDLNDALMLANINMMRDPNGSMTELRMQSFSGGSYLQRF